MALGDPYATKDQLSAYLELQSAAATSKQALLEQAVLAASKEVENFCGRQFNKADTASARLYRPSSCRSTTVDDFWSTDGLIIRVAYASGTFGSEWLASDYRLYPLNGVVDGVPGRPYRRIHLNNLIWSFTNGELVEVTAKWGWATVPADVHQATLLLAAKHFHQRKSPVGDKAGFSESGGVVKVGASAQACKLLKEYAIGKAMVA
jgi:hypothetical protein